MCSIVVGVNTIDSHESIMIVQWVQEWAWAQMPTLLNFADYFHASKSLKFKFYKATCDLKVISTLSFFHCCHHRYHHAITHYHQHHHNYHVIATTNMTIPSIPPSSFGIIVIVTIIIL